MKQVETMLCSAGSPRAVIVGEFYDRRLFESLNLSSMRRSENSHKADIGKVGDPLRYSFSELTDKDWNAIRASLRPQALRGGETVARAAFNGMLWYAVTGKSFKQMPMRVLRLKDVRGVLGRLSCGG